MTKENARFWAFSVETYRQPGVADACLALQERLGIDVNVLLYCCWVGRTLGPLDPTRLEAALAFSRPWAREVVRPLRAARRWMKAAGSTPVPELTDDYLALRERIKTTELEAEHLQQRVLEGLTRVTRAAGPQDPLAGAASNIRGYLELCEIRLDDSSLSELAHIVTAAIDGAERETVYDTLCTTFRED